MMKLTLLSISSILIPLVATTPVLNVNIQIADGDQVSVLNHWPEMPIKTMKEKIPGWVFVNDKSFRARVHGNTFWNVKGTLDEQFPLDEFLFDPILFSLDRPEDFNGKFNGTVGRGRISLEWPKSGATIEGRSPIGDFEVKGTSEVVYSP